LADGDFVDLDWVTAVADVSPDEDAPLVLVVHGLEGSAQSDYVLEMHRALARHGFASVALNLRSCSGEPNRLPRFYHAGDTADLATVLDGLRERQPRRPLGGVGFSLGANVFLKYLGERGDEAVVDAAAAISSPFDLTAGIVTIERGLSRAYQWYFLRRLRRKVRAKARILDGRVDVPTLLEACSLREFDEHGTAPLHGFAGWADYYDRASCKRFLPDIRRRTLVIRSMDDPFLRHDPVPHREIADNPFLAATFPRSGGHVGFVSGTPWTPVFWAERTAAEFLSAELYRKG
jgi:predicted alpha/beta-fold hydrolase